MILLLKSSEVSNYSILRYCCSGIVDNWIFCHAKQHNTGDWVVGNNNSLGGKKKLKNEVWSLYTWQVSKYMLNCKNITHSKRIFMCPFLTTCALFFSHVTKTVATIYKYMHNQIAIDLAMPFFDVPCLNLIYKAVLHYFKLSMICDSWIFKSNLHLPFLHACLLVICLICPLFRVYLQIV